MIYRDRDDPFYEASCTIYAREWNTVAFSAGRDTGYRLFANGVLGASLEKTGADYRFLSDAASWSSCSVGKTVRGNDPEGYPFTGTIERLEIYAGALPDEELAARTAQTQRGDAFVFYAGDATGSAHFRIPFLWNTPDGDADRRGGRQFRQRRGFGRKHRYRIAAQAQRGRIRGDGGLAGCVRAGCDAHAGTMRMKTGTARDPHLSSTR